MIYGHHSFRITMPRTPTPIFFSAHGSRDLSVANDWDGCPGEIRSWQLQHPKFRSFRTGRVPRPLPRRGIHSPPPLLLSWSPNRFCEVVLAKWPILRAREYRYREKNASLQSERHVFCGLLMGSRTQWKVICAIWLHRTDIIVEFTALFEMTVFTPNRFLSNAHFCKKYPAFLHGHFPIWSQ